MAADTTPESWQEIAILTMDDGTTKTNFALITESFEINGGEKGIEGLPLVNGGRIAKLSPETDTEFTAKIIPLGVAVTTETTATGFWQRFQPQATPDVTQPLRALNSRLRNKYTVAVVWSTQTQADAMAASTANAVALRFAMRNAYITKLTHSFTTSDGLMADITFKCPAFGKDGTANVQMESTDGTGTLPILAWS